MKLAALLLIPALALAGCASNGMLNSSASAVVTGAYNDVCPALPALGALPMNSNQTAAYKAAVTICAAGAPTNVVVGALDIVAVDAALAPLISKVKIKL